MARQGMMWGPNELNVESDMLSVGDKAPDFSLIANNSTVRRLWHYDGKIKIISCIPSLDTRVCATQTRTFNQRAAELSDSVVVLTVSSDLPFAQGRWCAAEGIDRVETLSDHKTMQFANDYGVHCTPLRICQRAVFVLDQDNIVRHVEYVFNTGTEPAYDPVLEAAKRLV